ncbi:MAG: hypothetical protein IKI05_01550 [Bacteroidaceae bacterium]|nr:hypothetical protein [Clostridia bacterium]MBR7028081.1 hypothetical protein [Bacteroidaceae bacterium]
MMNYNKMASENGYTKISIVEDREMIKALENEYQQHCMALKNEELGFGVWFTEELKAGIYGDDDFSVKVADLYWNEYAEEIFHAFDDAETLDDAIDAANKVILGASITILRMIYEMKAS